MISLPGAARALLLGAALALCAGHGRANETGDVLLADTGGAIHSVVIAVNSARRAALRNTPAVEHIVNALAADVAVDILTNDRAAFRVVNNPAPGRIRFLELPPGAAITIWPQDPFLVLRPPAPGARPVLLASRDFDRAGDAGIAPLLAAERGYELRQSSLFFEGGNVVSDESRVLIGANTIRYNAIHMGVSDNEAGLAFQGELGKPVLVVGPYPQPVAHIDMMLTPLGDGRIAVADAAAGIAIAEAALDKDPESVAAFERHCKEQFFGHPQIHQVAGADGEAITPPPLEGRTRELLAINRRVAPLLDAIAASLADAGYEVLRIPFYFGGPEGRPGRFADAGASVAAFPMLTYNNALLETRDGVRRVYLPRYGWRAMDEAAQQAWKSAGFAVTPVAGLTTSAMYGGALRCAVKVLARD